MFTGNELGAILGWWCLYSFKEKNKDKKIDYSKLCFLSSNVSSKILNTIAKTEGLYFEVIHNINSSRLLKGSQFK